MFVYQNYFGKYFKTNHIFGPNDHYGNSFAFDNMIYVIYSLSQRPEKTGKYRVLKNDLITACTHRKARH